MPRSTASSRRSCFRSRATARARDACFDRVDAGRGLAGETQHVRLTAAGVRSVCVMPASFAGSSANRALLHGAEIVPARGAADALAKACAELASPEPIHANVYLPTVDTLMHKIGPDAPAAHAELVALLDAVVAALRRVPPETLVLIVLARLAEVVVLPHPGEAAWWL